MTDREFLGKMYFLLQREPRATVICDQLEDMLAERLKQPETRPATREEKIVRPGVYEVPVEQEPVAFITNGGKGELWWSRSVDENGNANMNDTPLYTTPPRREWVGLTEEERSYYLQTASNIGWWKAAEIIEAKLKHKNTVRMRRATREEKIVNPGVYWVEDKE